MTTQRTPAVLINQTTTCAICGWDLVHPHRGRAIPAEGIVRLVIDHDGKRTPIALHAPCLMRDSIVLGSRVQEALRWRDEDTESLTDEGTRIFHASGGRVA